MGRFYQTTLTSLLSESILEVLLYFAGLIIFLVVEMEKVTGITRMGMKSQIILGKTCMSPEEIKWSLSIAIMMEEVQEYGDVIYLIVVVH